MHGVTTIARKRPKILPYTADLYTVTMVGLCFYLLIAPLYLDLSWPVAIAWVIVSCMVNFIVNLIDHNHIHVPTFGYRWMNLVFGLVLTVARGASERFTHIIHNTNHHKHEGSRDDWFWPGNEGTGILFLRPFVYVVNTAKRFKEQGKALFSGVSAEFRRIQWAERICLAAFFAFVLSVSWQKALVYILIPWLFGNYMIVFTNLLFHKGCEPGTRYNHSKNYLNKIEGFFFLNGGFHTIHHLKPGIHWSKLPAMHERYVAPYIDPKYILDSMFVDTWREYFDPFRQRVGLANSGDEAIG